ncbi:MAG: hypothetical protein QG623_21 [Patescibacteria group bacterium]|nr:hypothetical protein [Patescibacteria group bacterium]
MQTDLKARIFDSLVDLQSGKPMSSFDSGVRDDMLEELGREASELPMFFSRDIAKWERTRRATFFPDGAPNTPRFIKGIFCAQKRIPHITSTCLRLIDDFNEVAKASGAANTIPSLSGWAPNRIGINYMYGNHKSPAFIPPHTDPQTETGLVMSLELIGRNAGQLSLIFGADSCIYAGIGAEGQPLHSLETYEGRISVTVAQLLPNLPPAFQNVQ